jgi:hypothetical protein
MSLGDKAGNSPCLKKSRSLGLEEYEVIFRENKIDIAVLPKLTAEDLKELGVTALGHRRKLLDAVAALHADAAAMGTGILGSIGSALSSVKPSRVFGRHDRQKRPPRVQRHRQRRKRGERMVTIRLTQTEITRLAGIGYGAEPGKPETLALRPPRSPSRPPKHLN